VHRDLKPENLLVQTRGDGGDLVKILDFGIAKLRATENQADSATRTGVTLGTPYYMSPEQARGQKELDERADIYALGVILFELLSGQKPYNGDNYNAILFAILMQPPPRIETLRPNLPPGLADLVHRAMAQDANHRFSSAAEMGQALASFVGRSLTPAVSGHDATAFAMPPQQPYAPSGAGGAVSPTNGGTRAPVALTPNLAFTPPPTTNQSFFLALGGAVLVLGSALAVAGWFFFLRNPAAPTAPAAASLLPAVTATTPPPAEPAPVKAPEPVKEPEPAASAPAASIAATAPTPPPAASPRPAKGGKTAAKPAPLPPSPTPAKTPAPRPAVPAQDDDLFAP
jgi:serine/threonine-protein kinase